jgi:hypothetical protein
MRLMLTGALAGAMTLVAMTAGAQGSVKFSGIKLVDMHAQTPEQTVNVLVDSNGLSIVDAAGGKSLKTFNYAGLDVVHTVSITPPAIAGNPSAAPVGTASAPMYLGREPRNWLTLKSGDSTAVLRVSPHVFDKFKAALGEHNVKITEGK